MSIISLNDLHVNPDKLILLYCRASKDAKQLPSQIDDLVWQVCWQLDRHTGLTLDTSRIVVYPEVHSGCTFDRPEFRKAIAHAKRDNLWIVAPDINRLIRHPDFHPWKRHTLTPLKSQLRELVTFGVNFALAKPLNLTSEELRSLETKRGMRFSGRLGGRATIVDEKVKRKVLSLHVDGYTSRQIEAFTGVNYKTVQRIIKSGTKGLGEYIDT